METALYLGLEIAVLTLAIWGGIGLVDQGNSENTPGVAFIFASLLVVSSAFLGWVTLLPLVVFVWALIRYYDLAIWKCLAVLVTVVAAGLVFALFASG